jgi:YD repeat-containing protein
VRDVRGQVWTYQWYGQVSGQSDANQLDFLVEIKSPSVDTTGDGTADGSLSLEQLSYVTSGATITNLTRNLGGGLLTTAYAFQPGGLPKTTETIASKVSEHEFLGGVYKGFRDPVGNFHSQNVDDNYRPVTIFDANGNTSQMDWSGGGKQLLQQKDALNNAVNHAYVGSGTSTDALDNSIDPEGRKVKYEYTDTANPLRPTRVKFFDTNGTTVLRWQEFTYDSRGRVTSDRLIDPANGTTILKRQDRTYYTAPADPVGAKGLLQTIIDRDLATPANDVSTTLSYDDQGRVVKTHKTSMFGCCQFSYVVYDAAGLVVAEIKSRINQTAPTSAAAAMALFDPADPDKNRVTVYEYDAMGRRVKVRTNAGASFEQVDLTAYDALGRVIRSITNYVAGSITAPFIVARSSFGHGTRNDQNQVVDTAYNARGMVRQQIDALDNVSLFGYDDAGRLIKTIQNANQPAYNNNYTGTSPDPTLGSYSPVSNSDKDLVTTTIYDKAGNKVKITDPDNIITFMVYDALNRVVKTVRAAKDTATVSLNPGDGGYNATNDPRSTSYVISTEVDRDYIETAERPFEKYTGRKVGKFEEKRDKEPLQSRYRAMKALFTSFSSKFYTRIYRRIFKWPLSMTSWVA